MPIFLHSQRLIVRNFTDSDLESFIAYRNESDVAKYQGWEIPYTREQGGRFVYEMKNIEAPRQGQWLQLAVELKETNEMIGDLGIRIKNDDARQALIGFTLASAHWQKGFAAEALACLLEFLFGDLDLHRVSADCDTENIASWRTLEKLGFRREAYFVESYLVNRQYASEYHYGLLKREWLAQKS